MIGIYSCQQLVFNKTILLKICFLQISLHCRILEQVRATQSSEGHDPAGFSDLLARQAHTPGMKENPTGSQPSLDWGTHQNYDVSAA